MYMSEAWLILRYSVRYRPRPPTPLAAPGQLMGMGSSPLVRSVSGWEQIGFSSPLVTGASPRRRYKSLLKVEAPLASTTMSTAALYPKSTVIQAARLLPLTVVAQAVLGMMPLTTPAAVEAPAGQPASHRRALSAGEDAYPAKNCIRPEPTQRPLRTACVAHLRWPQPPSPARHWL